MAAALALLLFVLPFSGDTALPGGPAATYVTPTPAVPILIATPTATPLPAFPPIFDPTIDVQLNSNGIDVTWLSTNEEQGQVEWAYGANAAADLANKNGTFAVANDWRTARPDSPIQYSGYANKRTHRVRLIGAAPGSTIHYRIITGGYSAVYQVTIPTQPLTSPDNFMTGTVTYEDGSQGAECLVYFKVSTTETETIGGTEITVLVESLFVNNMADPTGSYTIGVTNIRDSDNFNTARTYSNDPGKTTATVIARCSPLQQTVLKTSTSDLNIVQGDFLGVPLEATAAVTVVIPLVSGFNLVAVPVDCASPISAEQLADLIAAQGAAQGVAVNSVQRWGVGGSQGFDGWLPGSTNPFTIEPGRGYFVKVSGVPSGFSVSITGARCSSVPLDFLVAGFNLIGVPFAPQGYDAKDMADLIAAEGGIVNSVQRWGVGGSQGFDGWLPGSSNPFPIDPRYGYFIKLSKVPTAPVSP